jgi:DNA mismatch endonuclease (patch repair protein)
MDIVDLRTRSRIMAAVPQKHSKPEIAVRKVAHSLGYRFQLHSDALPGQPDLVFPRLRRVVFVHGCFWHRHSCYKATTPKVNTEFWQQKFADNQRRDRRVLRMLRRLGWKSLIIWECQVDCQDRLVDRLSKFLGANSSSG